MNIYRTAHSYSVRPNSLCKLWLEYYIVYEIITYLNYPPQICHRMTEQQFHVSILLNPYFQRFPHSKFHFSWTDN